MKNKKLLVHIDYGSIGNSGLYISETLVNLDPRLYDKNLLIVQKEFEFPAPGVKKIFNFFGTKFNGRLLQVYKFFDLFSSLFVTLALIFKERNYDRVVVLSLNTPFIHYKIFAKILGWMGVQLYCILHDIVELSIEAPSAIIVKRIEILELADGFICHTNESYEYAKEISDNVFKYKFPLMNITAQCKEIEVNLTPKDSGLSFLFIGALRPEKGVQLLIESFESILTNNNDSNISLIIAGKTISGSIFRSSHKEITIIDQYLSEPDFLRLISEADYVVLPYLEGTNSGILSTVSSTLTPVLASKLPMFIESPFISETNLFELGSIKSLSAAITGKIRNREESQEADDLFIEQAVAKYEDSFKTELNECYAKILK